MILTFHLNTYIHLYTYKENDFSFDVVIKTTLCIHTYVYYIHSKHKMCFQLHLYYLFNPPPPPPPPSSNETQC